MNEQPSLEEPPAPLPPDEARAALHVLVDQLSEEMCQELWHLIEVWERPTSQRP
jgi:hypothetical protein